ncbi:MAG TPA: hypothetical protein VKF79_04320 [Candidatus Acidoferrum sp.]|nr:hypothetical protein [Candidatus Acidoferrum sp.]
MNKWLSVVALALLVVVAGLAWRGAVQSAGRGNNELPVITAQGSRPQPPLPPLPPPTQPPTR